MNLLNSNEIDKKYLLDEIKDVNECPSNMKGILDDFTKLYAEKLNRVNDTESADHLKKKICILENWVSDLGEQNHVLVTTVEELENEASNRVSLLQEKLDKMALVTRDSCLSLRDHQAQVSALMKEKFLAADDMSHYQEKLEGFKKENDSLLTENSNLRSYLHNVFSVLSTTMTIPFEHSFNELSVLRKISPDTKENLPKFVENILTEKSTTNSDLFPEMGELLGQSISKMSNEIQHLKTSQMEKNRLLTQKDATIAELQSRITELHGQLSASESKVQSTSSILHEWIDRDRHSSLEVKDGLKHGYSNDLDSQLTLPQSLRNDYGNNLNDNAPKPTIEQELSKNIDVMSLRLEELEEECHYLRHHNAALEDDRDRSQTIWRNDKRSNEWNGIEEMNSLNERKLVETRVGPSTSISTETQTEVIIVQDNGNAKLEKLNSFSDYLTISKLENELSEKNILMRELQNHLLHSREELQLKDETLFKVEQKLESTRRNLDEKEERTGFLTSQLTKLQLEISRQHGHLQQIRAVLESKSELLGKLESENLSLVKQLNAKSSTHEGIQKVVSNMRVDIVKKRDEIAEQRLAIATLQDALVDTKRVCDSLQSPYQSESDSNSTSNIFSTIRSPAKTNQSPLSIGSIPLSTNSPNCYSSSQYGNPLNEICPDLVSFPYKQNENLFHKYHQSVGSCESLSSLPLNNSNMYNLKSSALSSNSSAMNAGLNTPICPKFSNGHGSLLAPSPSDSGLGHEDFPEIFGCGEKHHKCGNVIDI